MNSHNQTIYTFFVGKEEIEEEVNNELAQDKNNIKSLAILSQIEYKLKYRYQIALNHIKHILELNPQNIDARLDIILIQVDFRIYSKENCLILINECTRIDPNYWRLYFVSGIFFNQIQDEQKGRSCLEKGLALHPNNIWILSYLTQIYSDKPSMDKLSNKLLQEIVQSQIYDCDILRYISYIYGSFKKDEESLYFLQKSYMLNSNSPQTLNNLGQIVRTFKKDNQKSIEYCQQAIELNPRLVNAYFNMGIALQNLQEMEKAYLFYKKSIQIKKLKSPYQRIYMICRQKDLKEAQYFIQKGNKLYPNQLTLSFYYLDYLSRHQEFNQILDLELFQDITKGCINLVKEENNHFLYKNVSSLSNLQFTLNN